MNEQSEETSTEEATTTTQTQTAETNEPKFSDRLRALKSDATHDRVDDLIDLLIADAEAFGF